MSDSEKTQRVRRRIRGSGSVFQKENSDTFVIQYYKDDPSTGRRMRVREYTGLRSRAEAQRLLTTRLYQIDRGELFDTRRQHAVTIADLFDSLETHTRNNNRGGRSVDGLGWRWKHLKPIFANVLAANLTTDQIDKYKRERQEEGAANATINRELATLRRMFNLGKRSTPPKVRSVPYISMLKENNARQGFVEDSAFARLAAGARELWIRAFIEMAFTYGWRRGELLSLRVRQIDFENRTVRLAPGTTKNGEGREVSMTLRVEELLRAATFGKRTDDFVLTREDGKPIREFRRAWANLCVKARVGEWVCTSCATPLAVPKCLCGGRRKYQGLIPHDLRRSAARQARRAGIAEGVIMKMGGWRTRSVFERYAIVSSVDQKDAVAAIEAARTRARFESESVSPRSAPVRAEINGSEASIERRKPQ